MSETQQEQKQQKKTRKRAVFVPEKREIDPIGIEHKTNEKLGRYVFREDGQKSNVYLFNGRERKIVEEKW